MTGTSNPPQLVVDADVPIDLIDHQQPRAVAGERAVPYHCPYCGDEDLRPHGATSGAWHCRTCTRTFSVKFLGTEPLTPTWPGTPAPAPAAATPTPTGQAPSTGGSP